jgi:hypothetical protein
VILIILVAKRNKTREDFSSEKKKEALSDQDYKCAICGKFMDHWDRDFDHKNGNRSDNKLSNCRALHPKCQDNICYGVKPEQTRDIYEMSHTKCTSENNRVCHGF